MSEQTPVQGLQSWAAERGQQVWVTERAALAFLVLRDGRWGHPAWAQQDVALAIMLGRKTLPWLPEAIA